MNIKKAIFSSAIAATILTGTAVTGLASAEETSKVEVTKTEIGKNKEIIDYAKNPFPKIKNKTVEDLYDTAKIFLRYNIPDKTEKVRAVVTVANGDFYTLDLYKPLQEHRKNIELKDYKNSYIISVNTYPLYKE